MRNWLQNLVERILPWYKIGIVNRRSERSARMSGRATRAVEEYRSTEAAANKSGKHAVKAVIEFKAAQENANKAADRIVAEVEKDDSS